MKIKDTGEETELGNWKVNGWVISDCRPENTKQAPVGEFHSIDSWCKSFQIQEASD